MGGHLEGDECLGQPGPSASGQENQSQYFPNEQVL